MYTLFARSSFQSANQTSSCGKLFNGVNDSLWSIIDPSSFVKIVDSCAEPIIVLLAYSATLTTRVLLATANAFTCVEPVLLIEDTRCSVPLLSNRSEEHTSELQSLMRISYAVFCLK